jgi:hypothetical protein
VLLVIALNYYHRRVEYGINTTAPLGLPKEGKSYTYRITAINGNVMFSADEKTVMRWIKENKFVDLGYEQNDGNYEKLNDHSVYVFVDEEHVADVLIEDGIFLMNRVADGGGYTIGYDRKTSMCYYTWSSN